ncbi:hypothetical protein PIN31115_01047 [Pandoraea iniqua]|uniref:DUF7822 domain-containing protein n=1 Tax=Pandoraea iniqua TaxID=2508288 RepID=A0A5E4SV86_9BURK|nr:hypothetical protein [Pandoraea iniqua]VVD79680.1 hypothetical protein PIN31115_01047 [Pandoraea iniqua]
MAYKSLLLSVEFHPEWSEIARPPKIACISKWKCDVPLVYKLLISGDVRACKSLIWGDSENIALIGDYAQGVARLESFLGALDDLPEAKEYIQNAANFLRKPECVNHYFVLECAEIFEMSDGSLDMQNSVLLEEVKALASIDDRRLRAFYLPEAECIQHAAERSRPTEDYAIQFFHGLANRIAKLRCGELESTDNRRHLKKAIKSLGLDAWTNTFYYEADE